MGSTWQNKAETLQSFHFGFYTGVNYSPQSNIMTLVGYTHRRLEALVAARGGHTRYYILQTEIPDNDFDPYVFSPGNVRDAIFCYCVTNNAITNLFYLSVFVFF